jgi:hypothetical protein
VADSNISLGTRGDLAAKAARLAAPVFNAAGWEWRDIGVPDEADIAASLAPTVERIDFEGSIGSGRLHVVRSVEDGHETISVLLELASGTAPLPGLQAESDFCEEIVASFDTTKEGTDAAWSDA